MNRKSLLLWPLLIAGVALLAGCQANNQVKKSASIATNAAKNSAKSSYAKLDLLKSIPLPEGAVRVKRIAITNDGAYIAIVDADTIQDKLHIWSISDGKLVYNLKPGYGLSDIAWNPKKQELALSAASGEPMSRNAPIYRGFAFLDLPERSLRMMFNPQFGENTPFDWTPDGKLLVTDFSVFNPQTKQNIRYKVNDETLTESGKNVAVSSRQMLAKEVVDNKTRIPLILIFKATAPDFSSLHKVGELVSKTDYDTNETVTRTQPRFLANGRLGYVWAILNPYNKPKVVEIRTCNEKGQDERSWIKLPILGQGTEGKYSLAPITWSTDGKIVTLIDGKNIKVFRVLS